MIGEARIVVNGVELNDSQSLTIRIALDSFRSRMKAEGLGDDEHGRFMSAAYVARATEVLKLIFQEGR